MNSKIRKSFIYFILTLVSFNLISCKDTNDNNIETKGFIWVAKKDNISINLIGTLHPAPPSLNFFNDNITSIIENTDMLSVEVDTYEQDIVSIQKDILQSFNFQIASEMLTEDEIDYLLSFIHLPDFDLEYLNTLTPSSIIGLMDKILYKEENYSTSFDSQLKARCRNKNIDINQLESYEFQVNLLVNSSSWNDVKNYIELTKDKSKTNDAKDYINETIQAYINGNAVFYEKDLDNMKISKPDFYEEFVIKRNYNMAKSIDTLVQDGKNHTIAIGVKHYFGEDSILKQLESLGYTISEYK